MNESTNLTNSRLAKLRTISKLFTIPLLVFGIIILLDFFLNLIIVDGETLLKIRRVTEVIAFYSFILIMFYVVFVTYYSSYRILESKSYKNLILFIFIQIIGFFVFKEVGINIPENISKTNAIIYTALISILILLFFMIPTFFVKVSKNNIKDDKDSLDETKKDEIGRYNVSESNLGLIFSGIFSLIISAMLYLRITKGIQFISWGVIFGSLLTALFIKPDKAVLALFYFLDPKGAYYLFELQKLKNRSEGQKYKRGVIEEQSTLQAEIYHNDMKSLALELEHLKFKTEYDYYKELITNEIKRLKHSNELSGSKRLSLLEGTTALIEILKSGKEPNLINQLLSEASDNLSIEEKIDQLIGLDPEEIKIAIEKNIIDASQKYFWTYQNQKIIKAAIIEFNEGKYEGYEPIYIAKSINKIFSTQSDTFKRMLDILNSTNFELEPIKGSKEPPLFLLKYNTQIRNYVAIIRKGPNESIQVHSIIQTI